jgi:hypothetical protein
VLKLIEFDPVTGSPKGAARELYAAPTDRGGGWSIRTPAWSPDGRQLAVILQTTGWDKIYVVPVSASRLSSNHRDEPFRAITNGEGEDDSPVFSPDGRSMAFVSNRAQPEERHIRVVPVHGRDAPARVIDLGQAPKPRRSGRPTDPASTSCVHAQHTARAAQPLRNDGARGLFSQPRERVDIRSRRISKPQGSPCPRWCATEVGMSSRSRRSSTSRVLQIRPGADFRPQFLWIHGGPEGQDGLTWDP